MKELVLEIPKARAIRALLGIYSETRGFLIFGDLQEHGGDLICLINPIYTVQARDADDSELAALVRSIESDSSLPKGIPKVGGFLTYEYGALLEGVAGARPSGLDIGLGEFSLYAVTLVIGTQRTSIFGSDSDVNKVAQNLRDYCIEDPSTPKSHEGVIGSKVAQAHDYLTSALKLCSMTEETYINSVGKIKNLILDGEVYQVNLCQRLTVPIEDANKRAEDIFVALLQLEDCSYGSFYRSVKGDYSLVSISPELLFRRNAQVVSTQPIKGTIARNHTEQSDIEVKTALLDSKKDLAELAMIVDLMRNDLGKIALPGSVEVTQYPRVLTLRNLYHMCADIQAKVPSEISSWEVVKALFPSGSITGTPKIAAMKVISEIEPVSRGAYCGGIGWFGRDAACFNVAIRTAVTKENSLYYGAGGGITIGSKANSELLEWVAKAKVILDCLQSYRTR